MNGTAENMAGRGKTDSGIAHLGTSGMETGGMPGRRLKMDGERRINPQNPPRILRGRKQKKHLRGSTAAKEPKETPPVHVPAASG